MRPDKRKTDEVRPIEVIHNYTKYAPGSILMSYGDTKVLCTASYENKVPRFLKDSDQGWLTAEYSMIPSSSNHRISREVSRGKPSGRTSEIQRLIGRSLRAVVDLSLLGERTIHIDADVIQADGGTRTASITGGMIALGDLVQHMLAEKSIQKNPIKEWIAAISVGKFNGEIITDLNYEEDSQAELDMNIVMTESGKLVEVQGTAEKDPFTREELTQIMDHAQMAVTHIIKTVK